MSKMRKGARRRRRSLAGAFYVLLGVVVFLGTALVRSSLISERPSPGTRLEIEGLDAPESLVPNARGVIKGDPNARLSIIEFGDYECPACGIFARSYEPMIDETFIQTGRARFVFYDLPLQHLHPRAFLAARAARCAEDAGRFWEYHDLLFQRQLEWSHQSDPFETLETYARSVGLPEEDFSRCVDSNAHSDRVMANARLAEALGISGTPTILVHVSGGETWEVGGWDTVTIAAVMELADGARPRR